MSALPGALFIAPVQPQPTGNGLAMRAWAVLHALAAHYDVRLLVGGPWADVLPPHPALAVPWLGAPLAAAGRARQAVARAWPGAYRRIFRAPAEWARPAAGLAAALAAAAPPGGFVHVHVFRLYMAPLAAPLLGRVPCALDLDDLESRTRTRFARLAAGQRRRAARRYAAEARFYAAAERQWLPRFDRLYTASDADRLDLARDPSLPEIRVLPNVAPVPDDPPPPPAGAPFRFLVVGSLGYFPNDDGVRFLLREILPRLRVRAPDPFELRVVGGGASARLARTLRATPDVRWDGFVPRLADEYAACHAALVPVRTGGGTRIKLLEAMAHARPVVATTAGAEGVPAPPGVALLVEDEPEGFTDACLRLMHDEALRSRLAAVGRAFAARHCSPERLPAIVAPMP